MPTSSANREGRGTRSIRSDSRRAEQEVATIRKRRFDLHLTSEISTLTKSTDLRMLRCETEINLMCQRM